MKFRSANLDDLPTLLQFEQHIINTEKPLDPLIKRDGAFYYDLEDLIVSDQSDVIVVEHRGNIIATGYVQMRNSNMWLEHKVHAYLGFMYVAPEFRGQGINQQVIERLLDWSKQKGVYDIYLEVYAQKEAAIKAYEKAGFTSNVIEMQLTIQK